MLSAKPGNYWYHVLSSLVWSCLDQGLNPGHPALEASYPGCQIKEMQ